MAVNSTFNMLLAIIVFFIIIVYFQYRTKYAEKLPETTYTEGKMEIINKSSYHKGNVFDYNPNIPVQMAYFPNSDDYSIEPQELHCNEAIVVYGYIPSRYTYWGITGYICDYVDNNERKDYLRPISNTISSKYIFSASNTHIVTVLTYNQKLYECIKKTIIRELQSSGYLCIVYPIYIPKELLLNKARFTIINETIIDTYDEQVPDWACRLYSSNNILYTEPKIVIIPNEEDIISETNIVSLNKWKYNCNLLVKDYIKIVNTHGLTNSIISKDITCIESNIISLEDNESLFIVCVDHSKSGKSIYSYISIHDIEINHSYKHIVTGNIRDLRSKITNKRLTLRFIYHKPSVNKIRIKEFVYIDPTSKSLLGPDINTLLPMQIFIVKDEDALKYDLVKFRQ